MSSRENALLPDNVIERLADALWSRVVGSACDPIELNLRTKLALEHRLLGGDVPFCIDKLRTEETAVYLDLQPETLRDRQKRRVLGLPEPYRFGRKLHWRRSELDAWIEAQRERTRKCETMGKHLRHARSEDWLGPFHTRRVMETADMLYPTTSKMAEPEVRHMVDECLRRHPPGLATRRQAALHEAGHLVAYEAEKMGAGRARISRSAFVRDDWGGEATPQYRPLSEPLPYRPADLMSEARAAIAGPLSESLLGNGDFFASISEILELHLLSARAAEMLGCAREQILIEILMGAAAIVDSYSTEIEKIATFLERRRYFTRLECKKPLARVRDNPVDPRAEFAHIENLKRLVAAAAPDIERLISQITMPEIAA